MMTWSEQNKPDWTILLGDLMDFRRLNTYKKEYGRVLEEIELSKPHLDRLASLKNVRLIIGNHDYRIERIFDQMPQMAGLLDFAELCKLPKEWEIYPNQTLLKMQNGPIFLHGDLKNAMGRDAVSGAQVADKMRRRLKHSCVFGHFHRNDIAPYLVDAEGNIVWEGHCCGWLGDALTAGDYTTAQDWTVSFGTMYYDESGWDLSHHVFKNNRYVIDGRVYK